MEVLNALLDHPWEALLLTVCVVILTVCAHFFITNPLKSIGKFIEILRKEFSTQEKTTPEIINLIAIITFFAIVVLLILVNYTSSFVVEIFSSINIRKGSGDIVIALFLFLLVTIFSPYAISRNDYDKELLKKAKKIIESASDDND